MTAEFEQWLAYLSTQDCPCPYEYKNLGKLYGISMGKGWVRTGTDPHCPHHRVDGGQT